MSILKIKNAQGEWESIKSIRGKQGERGPQGIPGKDGGAFDDTKIWEAIGEHDRDIQNLENDVDEIQDNLATRLATDLENIDEAGIEKINGYIKSYVDNLDAREVSY